MWRKTPKCGTAGQICGRTTAKCGRQKTQYLIKSMTYKQSTHYIHRIEENFLRSGGKISSFEPFPFTASTDLDGWPHTATDSPIAAGSRTDAKKPPDDGWPSFVLHLN